MKIKKILASVVAMAMSTSLVPVSTNAAGETANDTTVESPVRLEKTLIETAEGMPNELRLEAYVTGSLEKSENSVPTDIVLVLDQSGSMDDKVTSTDAEGNSTTQTKLATMKEAVKIFTTNVQKMNTGGDGSDYRVAIVGFASENSNTEILTTEPVRTYSYLENNPQYSYIPVDSSELDRGNVYYIESGTGYESIEYYEYLLASDGWYTDGGRYSGGSLIEVSSTAVYERIVTGPSALYGGAFVNCTAAEISENGRIYEAIEALDGNGATRTDLGMEMAEKIFETQPEGTYDVRKKIVVVLTDGVPTTSSDFSGTVANNAISYAKGMKDKETQVFSLYFGTPSENSVNFMQGMSSNYPDATAYTELGTQAATTYYSAHNNSSAITDVFNEIVYSIAADVNLDEKAILQDELTKYFKLPDSITGDREDQIRVYTSDRLVDGWGEEKLFENAVVKISEDGKTINVSGFDYAHYCVTTESKSETSEDYGKKIVVYIPIVADETSGTIGGYLPTNVHAGVYEDDVAVEAETTAVGKADDVGMGYVMENDEFFAHIGTDNSYVFNFNAENMNPILDEMLVTKPDGENNTGVKIEYRIYDTNNTTEGAANDDTLIAKLVVEAGDNVDVTDINNWTFEEGMDSSTITVDDGKNSANKIFLIACRTYNINPKYENNPVYNLTYGLLNVTVINEDVHIVGGVIDDGGVISVPDGSAGTLIHDLSQVAVGYTEEIVEGEDSAVMTFALREGYVFRRIIEKTSVNGPLDTSKVLYDIETGENNVNFESDGTYKYQIQNANGGQVVEVYTQPEKFALTTKSDENSLIIDSTTYDYSSTEKLNVPFSAKEGYSITSIKWGKTEDTAVELAGKTSEEIEALGVDVIDAVTAEGYDAQGNKKTIVIQGEVAVPRTHDNYVSVVSSPINYKLTYKQYKQVYNNNITTYEPYGEDVTHIVPYNESLVAVPVESGTEKDIDGSNYTLNGWFKNHPNNEFTGLVDVSTMLMPIGDLTLHAYWAKNPDVRVDGVTVNKTVVGNISGSHTFKFDATFHEHVIGTVQLTVSDAQKTASGTVDIVLTDRQYDSFVSGDKIRLREIYEGDDTWLSDDAEYVLEYSANSNIIKKDDKEVSSSDFTNYYNAYKVEYDLNGGTYNGSDSVNPKTVKWEDANLIPQGLPAKDGSDFIGWKYDTTTVNAHTVYKDLAVNYDVTSVTLVAQWEDKEYNDVIYDNVTDPVREDKYIIVDPNGGTWSHEGSIYTDEVKLLMNTDRVLDDPVRDNYAFAGWVKTNGTGDVVHIYTAHWESDEIGEQNPDEPDDIPDIYQKKITFKVVNGTWSDDTTADIVKVVTLKDDAGNDSIHGKAPLTAPTGMKANENFINGAWDTVPPAEVTGTDEVTYTYSYLRKAEPFEPSGVLYVVEHYKVGENGEYPTEPTEKETLSGHIGETVNATAKTYDGYALDEKISTMTGTLVNIKSVDDIVVLKLYYDIDEIGGEENPEEPDEVPDIYQKKIIFKIKNGTWADGKEDDIVIVADLLDENGKYSKDGTADIKDYIPEGMKADSGYKGGEWDNVPAEIVSGTEEAVYTYSFTKKSGGGGGGATTYALHYETNGGSEIKSEQHVEGTVVNLTKVPEREGYIFEGWHLDKELNKDAEKVTITHTMTVYAAWVEDNGEAGKGHTTPGSLNDEDHFAYVVGYPDGTVRPNANISRAEVTSIFFRLLEEKTRLMNLTSYNTFDDVEDGDWFNKSVSTMAAINVIKGRSEDVFAPDDYITRAEFAAICARFDDSEFEVVDDFSDVQGHWAEAEIHEAAAHGWIKGYEDNTFKPDRFITRAEAMTMINRVLNRIPETADDLLDDMVKWPDNSDESQWYYLAVQEATNSHEYDKKNKIYEKWTSIMAVDDWTKYE